MMASSSEELLKDDGEEDEMTSISLVENVLSDAVTIETALSELQDDPVMTRQRDAYMLRVQEAMRTFKELHEESRYRWPIIGDPTARLKQYYRRDARGQRFMKIRGRIRCSDPRRIIIMERDYCWKERRHRWDTQVADIAQHLQYDCRDRGIIRLVSCSVASPLCLFSRRSFLGLQWDRYRSDSNTATLLYETLSKEEQEDLMLPELLTKDTRDVEAQCFVGIHVRGDVESVDHCFINYIVRIPPPVGKITGVLFDHYYKRALMRRMQLYEHVMDHWDDYYPDNGRVIR